MCGQATPYACVHTWEATHTCSARLRLVWLKCSNDAMLRRHRSQKHMEAKPRLRPPHMVRGLGHAAAPTAHLFPVSLALVGRQARAQAQSAAGSKPEVITVKGTGTKWATDTANTSMLLAKVKGGDSAEGNGVCPA